jgi:UDP-N-acetylmuramate--alanine ligase
MHIHYQEDISLIPHNTWMVVYTPAIPSDNTELQYLKTSGIQMLKRAEVLGMLSKDYKTIACAGTHGKTTTSSLVATLMHDSEMGCQAFLGGIARNFNSNLVISEESPFMVVEADEYDRSFLHLHPYIAIITSMDADHLDVYKSKEAVNEAFMQFAQGIVQNGFLIAKKGLPIIGMVKGCTVYEYSVTQEADFWASDLQLNNGLYTFSFHYPGGVASQMTLGIPGLYNVENAVAALAAAWLAGVQEDSLRKSLALFKGVKRRFDIRYRSEKWVYIDDYAHHPAEIDACIASARAMFTDRQITGIFQPHLFSRTRDFALEFARSLSNLDKVVLLPIYPARELPMDGVDSRMLQELIQGVPVQVIEKEDIINYLKSNNTEVLLTMGAGDIDTQVSRIEHYFESQPIN